MFYNAIKKKGWQNVHEGDIHYKVLVNANSFTIIRYGIDSCYSQCSKWTLLAKDYGMGGYAQRVWYSFHFLSLSLSRFLPSLLSSFHQHLFHSLFLLSFPLSPLSPLSSTLFHSLPSSSSSPLFSNKWAASVPTPDCRSSRDGRQTSAPRPASTNSAATLSPSIATTGLSTAADARYAIMLQFWMKWME